MFWKFTYLIYSGMTGHYMLHHVSEDEQEDVRRIAR